MNTVTFIYKKKENLCFLNIEDSLMQETKLKKHGWKHIATVDPAILLSKIYDVCQEEYSSDEKISDIVELFVSF